MKKEKVGTMSLQELAEDWGIDYEVYKIKAKLVERIKSHCEKSEISQRALAKMVPGLTQDRISKVFSGQVGHMTIDKLVQILSALDIKVNVSLKSAA